VPDIVVVADAGMLSAANLNALEDAGFSFIVGSRITKAPYDLAEHFERHGNYFTDGQVLESARRMMGTGKAARVRRAVYQWKFKREQHDNKAINAMIERAEKIAGGRAPLKKARFLKVTDITTEPGQVTIDRARQFAGLKGYVTNLPASRTDGAAVIACQAGVPPSARGHRGPPDRRVRRPGPSPVTCRTPPAPGSSRSSRPCARHAQRPSRSTANASPSTPTSPTPPATSSSGSNQVTKRLARVRSGHASPRSVREPQAALTPPLRRTPSAVIVFPALPDASQAPFPHRSPRRSSANAA
jgi:hypothetical protein